MLITKSPYLMAQPEYVNQEEFHGFAEEMYDFRDDVTVRFDRLETRFDKLDSKIDGIKTDIAEQNKHDMAIWREHIKHDFTVATELIQGNFDKRFYDVDKKLNSKLSESYFTEYMEDFQKRLFKTKNKAIKGHE